jgi:hypothetical protein
MRRTRFLSLLAVVILGSACASSGQPGQSRPRRNSNLITREELSELSVSTAYEAVRRLRPGWLQGRGRSGLPVVYRNNSRWGGDPRSLESIQINAISEMRFLNARDATTRYGTGFSGGVILVVTR